MFSECCECDKTAVRYWGLYAYCRKHVIEAIEEHPDAHKCPNCKTGQPAHVSWRGEPCGECRKSAGQARVMAAEHDEWKTAAHQLLLELAGKQERFNADDLRQLAIERELEEPHHGNCWGPIFSAASRADLIEQTGEHTNSELPTSQARSLPYWRKKHEAIRPSN